MSEELKKTNAENCISNLKACLESLPETGAKIEDAKKSLNHLNDILFNTADGLLTACSRRPSASPNG
jgi:hypothetical protein